VLHKIAASFVQLFDDCHSAHQIEQQNYLDLLDRLDACFGLARVELEAVMLLAADEVIK
jgi:hypothetical protein